MIKKFNIILFSIMILTCIPAVLSAQLNRIEFQEYDLENGLMVRSDTYQEFEHSTIVQSTLFSDYREVHGTLYPHKMIASYHTHTITSTLFSIKFNSVIEDSVFK